ncbi:hypothetical protein GOEFS_008_00050 [Gordonia effusa NBRC 100432]|uniref:Secreted protein n=1 Tax=Gordonia effusa NBRC 100432 TaxID=1077974 RepID=H0QUU5_9ACTN|nr:hypothetical protein [Gordonia effusa]GAB16596.1 hypothetical protein GOEFS_008_00050 [Gordonia effusa NBRC 100432]
MRKFIGTFIASLLVASCLISAHATASPEPVIYDCGGAKQTRPTTIIVYCGDAGITVGSIVWTTWARKSAQGNGIQYTKLCVPNCAEGGVASRPVSIRLYKIVGGAFTRITLSGAGGVTSYQLTGASPHHR